MAVHARPKPWLHRSLTAPGRYRRRPVAAGIGQVLFETSQFDADGKPVTTTFADYAMPSAAELPFYETVHTVMPTTLNPLGAKGLGEAGTTGSVAATRIAVADALTHLGLGRIDLPLTPLRIWEALQPVSRLEELNRLELDGSCTTVLTGLSISSGIGWSPDASTMYLNDSGTGCVDAFRFDGSSGAIGDRRTLVHIDQPGVVPDGLTVDEEGGIWVALWNGGAVHRYAPDGSLLASVQLPVQRPTSCAFGGPGRDTLFVTTARTDLDGDALARQPHAGKVFAIDGLGVRGLPCLPYRGRVPRSAER